MTKKNPFDIQADREAAEAREHELRVRREQYARDLAEVMRSRAGRHVVAEWIRRYGKDADPFDTNAMLMARKSGIRLVALELAQEIKASLPEEYRTMEAENG